MSDATSIAARLIVDLANQVDALTQEKVVLQASNDAFRSLVRKRSAKLNRKRARCVELEELLGAVSKDARTDTEELHDQIEQLKNELEHTKGARDAYAGASARLSMKLVAAESIVDVLKRKK
jgi:chromosome segregation ATPase